MYSGVKSWPLSFFFSASALSLFLRKLQWAALRYSSAFLIFPSMMWISARVSNPGSKSTESSPPNFYFSSVINLYSSSCASYLDNCVLWCCLAGFFSWPRKPSRSAYFSTSLILYCCFGFLLLVSALFLLIHMLYFQNNQNLLILLWIHDLSSTHFAPSSHMLRNLFLVSALKKVAQRKFLSVVSVSFKNMRVTIPSRLSRFSNNLKTPPKIYHQSKELHTCHPFENTSSTLSPIASENFFMNWTNCRVKEKSTSILVKKCFLVFMN